MSFKNYGVFVIRNAVYTLPSIDISLESNESVLMKILMYYLLKATGYVLVSCLLIKIFVFYSK